MSYQEKKNKIKTNKGREGTGKGRRREVGKEAGRVEARKEKGSKLESRGEKGTEGNKINIKQNPKSKVLACRNFLYWIYIMTKHIIMT